MTNIALSAKEQRPIRATIRQGTTGQAALVWASVVMIEVCLGLVLALSPSAELRKDAALTWMAVAGLVLVTGPLDAVASSVCLGVCLQGWLTSAMVGKVSETPAGMNVGTLLPIFALAVFGVRGRGKLPAWRPNSFECALGLLIITDFVAVVRGYEVGLPQVLMAISGYLRVLAVGVWAFMLGSRDKQSWQSRLGAFSGPLIVGASTFWAVAKSPLMIESDLMFARIGGLYDPNLTMVAVATVLPIAYVLLVSSSRIRHRAFAYGCLGLGIVMGLLSGSRTGMMALAGASIAAMLLSRSYKLAVSATTIGVMLYVGMSYAPDMIVERYRNSEVDFEATRVSVYNNAFREFLEYPLYGSGKWTYYLGERTTNRLGAHNTFLAALAEGGLVLAGAYLCAILTALAFAARYWHLTRRWVFVAAFAGTAAYALGGNGVGLAINDYVSTAWIAVMGYVLGVARFGRHVPNIMQSIHAGSVESVRAYITLP
jgi:hypothetical protein